MKKTIFAGSLGLLMAASGSIVASQYGVSSVTPVASSEIEGRRAELMRAYQELKVTVEKLSQIGSDSDPSAACEKFVQEVDQRVGFEADDTPERLRLKFALLGVFYPAYNYCVKGSTSTKYEERWWNVGGIPFMSCPPHFSPTKKMGDGFYISNSEDRTRWMYAGHINDRGLPRDMKFVGRDIGDGVHLTDILQIGTQRFRQVEDAVGEESSESIHYGHAWYVPSESVSQ